MENGIRVKKQWIELLIRPIQIESKRVNNLLQGMLAQMLTQWPGKMQALRIVRRDLRELAPFMTKISHSLELGGKVHWAGDEYELNRLIEETRTTGLAVVFEGDKLTKSMQRKFLQTELKDRFRFVFLTEHDPGTLLKERQWLNDFRYPILTSRWPTVSMRRDDWKTIFRAGVAETARELKLAAVPEIESEVYREVLNHNWSDQNGAHAIIEFGAKCLLTAYAYSHNQPDKITFEHARVSHERPLEMIAAQARETLPPPPESEATS